MNQFNKQKAPQIKQEYQAQVITEEQLQKQYKPIKYDWKSNCNNLDTTSFFKTSYPDPFSHNWMLQQQSLPHPYYSYYNYSDPYLLNSPYNMPQLINHPNKKQQQDNFIMAKTSDLFNVTPFFSRGLPVTFSHSMPHPQEYQQPLLLHQSLNIADDDQEESDLSPVVKYEEQSIKNSSQQRRLQQKQLKTKLKNQTKNIPKNYGKAMISFILTHLDWIQSQFGIEKREDLIAQLKRRKNTINAIVHLKQLWTTSKYSKQFRILSGLFLRKYSTSYIFNSRVSNYSTHIKYKQKLEQALKNISSFEKIKQD